MLAFSLSQDNAGELLTLAQQFQVGDYWYGRRGRPGPALWDLWNYLGDRGRLPRPLQPWRRGTPPPAALGSVALEYLQLGPDQGFALGLTCGGRRVLILPPELKLQVPPGYHPTAQGLDLLVLPAARAGSPALAPVLARLQPRRLIIYGGDPGITLQKSGLPCRLTRKGAVSAYLAATEVTWRQWQEP